MLGPLGFLILVGAGKWPLSTTWLVATNDLVWWLPFGLYLYDVQALHRADR